MVKKRATTAAADRFEAILQQQPKLISGFEPGKLNDMCNLASNIVAGYEYWIISDKKPVITVPGQKEIESWYRTVFHDQVCLVLRYDDKYYAYTRNNICKQLRGHLYHSDQNDRNIKEEAFRRYVFEGDKESYIEFFLSYCWLNSGGFAFDTGNLDSHNPYRERIKINDKEKVEFTTIESMVLSYALEFQSLSQERTFTNFGRIVQISTEGELVQRFGESIGKKCFETIEWHNEIFKQA
jgi:hypothetical protein